MGTIRHVISIQAPPDRVFERFDDLAALSRHFEGLIDDARKLSDGEYEIAYKSLIGRTHLLTVERTESIDGRLLAWRTQNGKVPITASVSLEHAGAQTFATFVLCYDPPGVRLGDVISELMQYPHKRLSAGLAKLVDDLEGS